MKTHFLGATQAVASQSLKYDVQLVNLPFLFQVWFFFISCHILSVTSLHFDQLFYIICFILSLLRNYMGLLKSRIYYVVYKQTELSSSWPGFLIIDGATFIQPNDLYFVTIMLESVKGFVSQHHQYCVRINTTQSKGRQHVLFNMFSISRRILLWINISMWVQCLLPHHT